MEKPIQIDYQKQIDLAAEALAQILIQQVMSKKYPVDKKQIDTEYGKQSR